MFMSLVNNKDVAARLKALRKAKGLGTQGNVAIILDVPTNTYNSWETGQRLIPVADALRICAMTGATLDYIYRGDLASIPGSLVTLLSEQSGVSRIKA